VEERSVKRVGAVVSEVDNPRATAAGLGEVLGVEAAPILRCSAAAAHGSSSRRSCCAHRTTRRSRGHFAPPGAQVGGKLNGEAIVGITRTRDGDVTGTTINLSGTAQSSGGLGTEIPSRT
jgi:hypothetical protein